MAEQNKEHYPAALSADGHWIVHTDSQGILYRKQVKDLKTAGSISISAPIKALSPSRSGKKVAFVTGNACIGIASFRDKTDISSARDGASELTWIGRFPNNGIEESPSMDSAICSNEGSQLDNYNGFSVALSSDGTWAAVAGNPIRVLDVASKKVVHEIPTGGGLIQHLRFVDGKNKLFVVQPVMGEQWESEPVGSDMQFAVWDLQKKELFSFHNTKTKGTLLEYDLLWDFSEATGELWAINTDGEYREPDPHNSESGKRKSIRPYSINLKHCGVSRRTPLSLPPTNEGWLEGFSAFAADPLGRYVAGVTPSVDDKKRRLTSTLWVRDSLSGKLLAQWRVTEELRAMAISKDGRFIYATTAGQPDPEQLSESRYYWKFSGGGELRKFDLSSKISMPYKAASQSWSYKACQIENEAPDARDIPAKPTKITRVFNIQLTEHRRQSGCDGDDIFPGSRLEISPVWQQSRDGELLVDRWDHLERISPENGRILQRVPTPRTPAVCSLPLFEHKLFLSWQGDTISLRPFAETVFAADRRLLVIKPGWAAKRVEWLGGRFGVRWLDSQYMDEKVGVNTKVHDEGSAMAIVYDLSGKILEQIPGNAVSGYAIFPSEQDPSDGENVFAQYVRKPVQKGVYRWESSYMGSVRAYRQDAATHEEKTILWAGLRFDKADGMALRRQGGQLIDLGDALGVAVDRSTINVYDAAEKRLLASIKINNVRNVAWNPVNRVLVVETLNRPNEWKLTGYRIE